MPAWISAFADILSIVGFGITVWTLLEVRKLQKRYLGIALLGPLQDKIRESSEKLVAYIATFDRSKPDISAELGRLEVNLEELKRSVPDVNRKIVQEVLSEIDRYKKGSQNKDRVLSVYTGTLQVLEDLRNVQERRTWQ